MEIQRTEHTPHKCFRCRSVDDIIAKCTKPHKDNRKLRKTARFNEKGNSASQKESENDDDDNYYRIYAYMARMYGND